ncbi:unnamed protein product [Victoria cruziana]
MDGNSWRPAQGDPGMVSNDWRSELSAESRQRIVNKIMETLKKHLPISGPEGVAELNKIAVRFEEKIYTAATSQPDYLRKISLKMLTMESKSTTANPLASNSAVGNQNPQDSAVNSMQQVRNQGQQLPLTNQSQGRQQILAQNLQNSVGTVQNTSNLTPALSSMSGISQASLSNVVNQSSTGQSISGISQNAVSNSMGQSIPQSMFSNSQRQLQARQLSQQVTPQQQQQQPQGQQHLLYQQHLQHQLMKQKIQQGNMQPSLLQQSHIQQQQSLLQPNQLQPSPQSHMQASQQPSMQPSQSAIQQSQTSQMQSVQQSSLQQSQQSSLQQSVPSVLQQHTHSVLRQQQQQQLQQSVVQPQPSMANQQQPQINQASMMSSQQQQQLMSQQTNSSSMQQNQIMGQQNIVSDMQQQQQQQQQRLLAQQSLSNMHQQQQMVGPQSNIQGMHQQPQQLNQQSGLSGMQQSQPLLSQQSNISSLQQHSHSIHQLLQAKSPIQHQQPQQAPSLLMQQQSQQPHSQPSQQQLMPQIQPQSAQQQIALQQQASSLQRELQQRLQTGGLLQPQGAVEQQKPSFQPQRGLPETSSPSIESTAQSAHPAAGDWQEEIYQKLKGLKDMYYTELNELYQKLTIKCQQQEALVQTQAQSDQLDKLRSYRNVLKNSLFYLIMPKNNIPLSLKDRMETFEKQLLQFLNLKNRKVLPPHQHGQQLQQQSGGQSLSVQQQQPQTQIPQVQQHESHTNQLQPVSVQVPVTTMQTSTATTIQHGTVPLGQHVGVPTSHNLRNVMQPASNLDSAQANNLGSLQQGAMSSLPQSGVGSMQPTMISAPQQTNASSLPQSGLNTLQQNSVNTIQTNNSMLQHQQQLKQLQQRQLQQHLIQQQHKQQMMQQPQLAPQYQQQQLSLHQKQQQAAQLQAHQMPQLHQLSDIKPGVGIKAGLFQPHSSIVQRPVHQQLKSGSSFPVSSPQLATSPQILQHSSPQIDQQSLLGAAALPKIGTPLQSASSPFVVPSPSTPVTPSQLQGDSEKPGASPLSKSGNIVMQQPTVPVAQAQSLAIGTPGISASPLLAEFTSQDANQGNGAALGSSSKSSTSERPFDRLMKANRGF